jgi:hypothetical protein
MSYQKMASRKSPALVYLLLDDSASMTDNLPGTSDPKFLWVARDTGLIGQELLERSTEMRDGVPAVKARYFLSLTSYGGSCQRWGQPVMSVEAFFQKATKDSDDFGLGGKFGSTDTAGAFQTALADLLQVVVDPRFTDSFPPLLFHLTDGESQTDARSIADQIKQLAVSDGNVLIVNGYIGTQTSLNYKGPEDFPGYMDAAEAGPSQDNLRLFEMSSVAPDTIQQNLVKEGIFPKFRPGARLFFDVRTKDMLKHVVQVIGSIPSQGAR